MKSPSLEDAILHWLAENLDDPALASQAAAATVSGRKYTGAGHFFGLSVSGEAIPTEHEPGDVDPVPGPSIESPELENGADSVVFVRDGRIESLEVFSFGPTFPKVLREYRLVSAKPRRPGILASSDPDGMVAPASALWGTVETRFDPIHAAARARDVAKVKELLSSGVEVDVASGRARNGDGGNTPLWFAAQGPRPNGLAVVRVLVDAGARIDRRCEHGRTALHMAAAWGHLDVVQFLVQTGAGFAIRDDEGMTAPDVAQRGYESNRVRDEERRPVLDYFRSLGAGAGTGAGDEAGTGAVDRESGDGPPESEGEEIFQTERLSVRRITGNDVDSLQAVYGDPDAMQWVDDGQPIDHASCLRWVDVTHRNYATRGYGMCALVLRETGSVIGFCGLVHPGGQVEVEIKYALLREHWDRGLATEAVRAMLDYGNQRFDIRQVIATTAPENVASHNVLEKVGMSHRETVTNDDGSFTKVFVWHADSGDTED